jgi:hypothetical protein
MAPMQQHPDSTGPPVQRGTPELHNEPEFTAGNFDAWRLVRDQFSIATVRLSSKNDSLEFKEPEERCDGTHRIWTTL